MGLRVPAACLLLPCCLSSSAGMLIAGGQDEIVTIGGTGSGLGGLRALARGVYPFYKVFYAVSGRKSKGATRRFVEYLNTPEARETLTRTGHLVLPRSK